MALRGIDSSGGGVTFVASSTLPAAGKAGADYICDGTQDNVQIQAAIDALPSDGGVVRLSEGTFTAERIELKSGTTLEGSGNGTILVLADSQDSRFITQEGWDGTNTTTQVTDISLRDMVIDGNTTGQSGIGTTDAKGNAGCVDFKNCLRVDIQNVTIGDAHGAGIELTYCVNVRVVNNTINGSTDDSIGVNDMCQYVYVAGNLITNPAEKGSHGSPACIEVQDGAEHIVITGNRIIMDGYVPADSAKPNGIYVCSHNVASGSACHNVVISGNTIYNSVAAAYNLIYIKGKNSTELCTDILVDGNILQEETPGAATRYRLENCERVSLTNNMSNSWLTGGATSVEMIWLGKVYYTLISNNHFANAKNGITGSDGCDIQFMRMDGNTFESGYRTFDFGAGTETFEGVSICNNTFVWGDGSAYDFRFAASDINTYTDCELIGNRFVGTAMAITPATNLAFADWTLRDNINALSAPYTVTTGASLTPWASEQGQYDITALGVNAAINAPLGTPVNGQELTIRILASGGPRTLTWNAVYQSIPATLPATVADGKTNYVHLRYNSADSKWDCISAVAEA